MYNNNYYMITWDSSTGIGTDVQLLKDDDRTEVNEEYKYKFGCLVDGYTPESGTNWRLF